MKHVYYVVYQHMRGALTWGVGSTEITIPCPITSVDHVEAVREFILKEHPQFDGVVVTNFIKLREEAE